MKKRNGFTLIELLVVISIIALLLSILLPGLRKAKELSTRIVCGSNFHQLSLVYFMYSKEYRDQFPRAVVKLTDEDQKIGEPIDNVMIPLITEDVYQDFKSNYQLQDKLLVCPAYWRDEKASITQEPYYAEDGKRVDSGELRYHWDSLFGAYRTMGIMSLVGLKNMRYAYPQNVDDSACKSSDPSYKLLAADWNTRWNFSWNDPHSKAAHVERDGFPAGCNNLHVDGSVNWVKETEMALDDTSISKDVQRCPGKYDHAGPSQSRAHFW